MVKNHTKFLVGVVLVVMLASALLAFSVLSHEAALTREAEQQQYILTSTPVHSTPTPTPTPVPKGTFYFSVPGGEPWGTTFDNRGDVWVALPGCDPSPKCPPTTPPGKIAEFDPGDSTWTHVYQLPTGYGQAFFLAFDKSGNLWFPMPMTDSLGELILPGGKYRQWPVPTAGAGPWDIVIDAHNTIWITEHFVNKIAAFSLIAHRFIKEVATPATNSNPYGITVDHNNNIWFTENNSAVALIGEYTARGQLEEYRIRNVLPPGPYGLTPHLITVDASGNIWWSEGWVSAIGKLDIAKARPGTNDGVTEYTYHGPCDDCGSHTSGIAIDSSGRVWFTDSLQNIFGFFNGSSFTLYRTSSDNDANTHPHDGLNIDAYNTVWFTEEFANKLARHA